MLRDCGAAQGQKRCGCDSQRSAGVIIANLFFLVVCCLQWVAGHTHMRLRLHLRLHMQ